MAGKLGKKKNIKPAQSIGLIIYLNMVPCLIRSLIITFLGLVFITGLSQEPVHSAKGLFASDQILKVRLSGNMKELMKDRDDDMHYHNIRLSYQEADSSQVSIPIKARTRGNFRRTEAGCTYPPLLLNFNKGQTPAKSIFHRQNKLKLVTPCSGDKYVLREYLVYRLYNLITPKSFRARLVKIVFDDSLRGKTSEGLFGILLEDEDQMARRNSSSIMEGKALRPEQTSSEDFLSMAVFQYMIGNTDWSVQYFQNVKLISSGRNLPSTVPYDFDHAGIVSAPYAVPEQALLLHSVRERRFRGYCLPLTSYETTIALFNQRKEEIYRVYTKCPWLEESYINATVRYLDEFFATINDPKSLASEFGYPCQKDGTGNVVIKGLKKK